MVVVLVVVGVVLVVVVEVLVVVKNPLPVMVAKKNGLVVLKTVKDKMYVMPMLLYRHLLFLSCPQRPFKQCSQKPTSTLSLPLTT